MTSGEYESQIRREKETTSFPIQESDDHTFGSQTYDPSIDVAETAYYENMSHTTHETVSQHSVESTKISETLFDTMVSQTSSESMSYTPVHNVLNSLDSIQTPTNNNLLFKNDQPVLSHSQVSLPQFSQILSSIANNNQSSQINSAPNFSPWIKPPIKTSDKQDESFKEASSCHSDGRTKKKSMMQWSRLF